jgi:xeroderma pigmentosum group C-complementing protein
MPPKARGRQKGPDNGPDISTEEVFDIISLGDTSDSSKSSSVIVTGARRVPRQKTEMASQRPRRETRASANKAQNSDVPAVYRDMVAEALSTENNGPERPLKRRRVGGPEELSSKAIEVEANAEDIDVDLDYLFEDVMPQTGNGQTIDTDSGEDSESGIDDDMWEEVDVASRNKISAAPAEDGGDLHLNLSTVTAPKSTPRRKSRVFSKADRALHLEIHKMHILCLLRYNDRRNRWCNDEEVQDILSPLLNEKVLRQFRTDPEWAQFRRTESIKKGLEMAGRIWETNFKITSRGIRRSYWAQDEQQLRDVRNGIPIALR